MTVTWVGEDEEFHTAECAHEAGHVVHLLAGSAGRSGWVWQARASADRRQSLQGMAATLAAAKAMAELALLAGLPVQHAHAA